MGFVLNLTRVTKTLFAAVLSIMLVIGIAKQSQAGTEALGATAGAATAITTSFTNAATANGVTTEYAKIDINGGSVSLSAITIAHSATLFIWDSSSGNEGLTGTGAISIAPDKTLTLVLGNDGDGFNLVTEYADLNINGDTTGGGSLVISAGTADAADNAGVDQVLDFNNLVTAENLTITGQSGDQGGAFDGSALGVTDLAGGILTINSALVIKAGLGSTLATGTGGLVIVTDASSMINAATVHISGGDGGNSAGTADAAAGGLMTISDISAGITATTITFSGGTGGVSTSAGDHDGGAGGGMLVSNITGAAMDDYTTINFLGGNGGAGSTDDHAGGVGGAGGAIDVTDLDAVFGVTASTFNISSGTGGNGGTGGSTAAGAPGGIGGAVSGFSTSAAVTGSVNVKTGGGGTGGNGTLAVAGGAAAAGGDTTFEDFAALVTGTMTLSTGNGGNAGTNGTLTGGVAGIGGAGGALAFADMHQLTGALVIQSGNGGAASDAVVGTTGAIGGAGGAIAIANLTTSAAMSSTVTITSGNGGNAGDGTLTAVGGIGGAGGAIANNQSSNEQDIGGAVLITSGNGATGGTAGTTTGAVGGAGGAITAVEFGDFGSTLTVVGGNGGTGGASTVKDSQTGGAGGAGGAVGINETGSTTAGNISYTAGDGGDGGSANCASCVGGKGGAGGVLTNLLTGAQASNVSLVGGVGGDGSSAVVGTGGMGGAGGTIAATIAGNIAGTVFLDDGAAGSAGGSAGGTAGAAGLAGTVVLNLASSTVALAVTVGDTGEGTINTATGAVIFSKSIGTSSKSLGALNAAIATTFTESVYVDTLDVNNGIAITNAGTSEQVYSGAITGDADLTVNAASHANLEGVSVFDTISIAALGRLEINEAVTIEEDNGLTITGTAILEIGSGIVAGETAITNDGSTEVHIAAALTVKMPENFTSGVITLIEDAGKTDEAAAAANITFTANTLASYAATNSGDAIIITATRKSAATIASALGITASAAGALDKAATAAATDAAVATIINTTLAAGGAGAKKLAEQIQGSADGLGATSGGATASAGAAVVSIGSSRMAALRTGNAYASTAYFTPTLAQNNTQHGTGFNAGSDAQSNSMWMKPFASFGDQGLRTGVAGYEADTYGLAMGADTRLNTHSIAGLSFSYADTDVDGKGAGNSHSDIRSYQLTAYADYTESDWYVEGLVGYAFNDMDTAREITATSATAKGDTNSGQYMVSVNAGSPMTLEDATGAKGWSGAYFTPTLGLSIIHVANKEYTETGAGVLNLKVSPEDITIVKTSLGGRLHTNVENSDGRFVPELRAKLLYDVAGDDGSSSNTFTGGGTAFNVEGQEVAQFAASVGVGFAFAPKGGEMDGMSLSVNYDAEFKSGFTGQSGNVNIRYPF